MDLLRTFLPSTVEIQLTEEQYHDPFLLMGITLLSVVLKTMNGIGSAFPPV